jgi:endonuclease/exonuclease/phosphatase family metal-dependent hydrolase
MEPKMYKLPLLTLLLSISLLIPKSVTAQTLKIASWNIAWLGSHKYNKRTDSDYQSLARYATELDADVIALQEVENADYARKVIGDDYDYYFSTKNWVQRVGVAVRKSKGFDVTAIEYKALDVGRVRYGMDLTLVKGEETMRLLAVHLKSGCFEKSLDASTVASMSDSSKRDKREKNACQKLAKQIEPLEAWIDQRAQEGIPFMVLGDFNRRFNKDIEFSHSETAGLWQAIDDEGPEDMWAPAIDKNSKCWGGYYKDFIDHIVFDPKAKAMYVQDSFEQLVFDETYTKQLSRTLSDHCPIAVTLNL